MECGVPQGATPDPLRLTFFKNSVQLAAAPYVISV